MKCFRYLASVLVSTVLVPSAVFGVEGMWQPEQLPLISKDLKAKGLELAPESLNDLTAYPMNAIVSLGGCSASLVSPLGLVITNYHCAYGSIQFNSTPKNNLIEQGFYAKTQTEELPAAPGSRIFVTESIEDVTSKVLGGLEGLSGLQRFQKIEQHRKALISACEEKKGYRCRIDAFLGESSYRLTQQLEIKDVRLVQAPPAAIGKFGGDIDNWMWPRHTGDFAFYRAYVDKNGMPADYSETNVPFKPKSYLKIDSKGVDEGSFVMVAGYPGRTNRHRLATEVAYTFEKSNQETKDYLDRRIALIEKMAAKKPELGLKYANQLAGMNNVSKNIEGELEGYKEVDLLSQKHADEKNLLQGLREENNKTAIAAIESLEKLLQEDQLQDQFNGYWRKAQDSDLLRTAQRLYRLARERAKPDAEREAGYQERDLVMMKQGLMALTRRFDPAVDQALWTLGLSEVKKADSKNRELLPTPIKKFLGKNNAELGKTFRTFYKSSILTDEKQRLALMQADAKLLESLKDPFMQLAVALYDDSIKLENAEKDRRGRFQQFRSDYMQTLVAYHAKQGKVIYPDANSTLRITYGNVKGYTNRKNLSFTPFTRLEEVSIKHTGKEPFNAPKKQLDLIQSKTYGAYALASLKTVPVNFLSDLDTTGGNSGSATLNSKGELTGLLFDGNIEGLLSDWSFQPAVTRSIHVDIRYILWNLEFINGAKPLLLELGVKTKDLAPAH